MKKAQHRVGFKPIALQFKSFALTTMLQQLPHYEVKFYF